MAHRRANNSGTLYKRNGVYYYKGKDANGRTFVRSCQTRIKEEADKAVKDFEFGSDLPTRARIAAMVEILKPKGANPTFDEAYKRYLDHPRNIDQSDASKKEDAGVWKIFLRWLHGQNLPGSRTNCKATHPNAKTLDDISEDIASEFITDYKASPQSRNKYIRVLKRVWTFNKMEKNPWSNFRKFKVHGNKRRAFTKDEVNRILTTAKGEMKRLFLFGAYTGQRMEDCAQMRWEMLSEDLTILMFTPRKTKDSSGIIVQIPLHKSIIDELQSGLIKKTGPIMPELAALTKADLSDRVQAFFSSLGLTESIVTEGYRNKTPLVGFHSFRSTFVSWCADANLPLSFVQTLVGHTSPELTQLYYRADTERARAFIDKL